MQRFFYAMTLTQLLVKGKLKLTRNQKSRIGLMLRDAAKAKGVAYEKVEETILVSDYPEDFVPDMENIVLGYLKAK